MHALARYRSSPHSSVDRISQTHVHRHVLIQLRNNTAYYMQALLFSYTFPNTHTVKHVHGHMTLNCNITGVLGGQMLP